MARVIWSPQALDDIDTIATFIEHSSPKYANLLVQNFFAKVELLETNPLLGRKVPEFNRYDFRELIVEGSYRIVYRVVDSTTLGVVTVHHSSRPLKFSKLGIELDAIQFLVQETFTLSKRPHFVIAGDLSHGNVASGMIIRHKGSEFPVRSIEMLTKSNKTALVSLVVEYKDASERELLANLFLKGDIIEIQE